MVKAGTGEGRVKIVQGFIGQEFNESLTGCDSRWKHKAEFLAVCHWGFYFDLSIVLEAFGSSYRQVNRIWKQWAPGRGADEHSCPIPFTLLQKSQLSRFCDTFLAQDTYEKRKLPRVLVILPLECKTKKEKELNQTCVCVAETISAIRPPWGEIIKGAGMGNRLYMVLYFIFSGSPCIAPKIINILSLN